jgi:hypothetical protein
VRFEARRATFGRGGARGAPAEVKPPAVFEGPSGAEDLQATLTYTLPRPASGTWDVYEFRMYPGRGNLIPPRWVRNWTTDADESAAHGNRTFQLALLVEAMIRGITEKNVFCEQYIAVGRD